MASTSWGSATICQAGWEDRCWPWRSPSRTRALQQETRLNIGIRLPRYSRVVSCGTRSSQPSRAPATMLAALVIPSRSSTCIQRSRVSFSRVYEPKSQPRLR